jgi:hypothetical protein
MSKPLYLYFTRPEAYEVYMGGKRSITVWFEPPQYRHTAKPEDYRGRYSERGWSYDHDYGKRARSLFKQDPDLLDLIWDFVAWSVYPKGMTLEQGSEWVAKAITSPPTPDLWGDFEDNYSWLSDDRNWEAKCNLSYKRFLLKVDVRNLSGELITPLVELPDAKNWVETTDISPYLATRYWVPSTDCKMPF